MSWLLTRLDCILVSLKSEYKRVVHRSSQINNTFCLLLGTKTVLKPFVGFLWELDCTGARLHTPRVRDRFQSNTQTVGCSHLSTLNTAARENSSSQCSNASIPVWASEVQQLIFCVLFFGYVTSPLAHLSVRETGERQWQCSVETI